MGAGGASWHHSAHSDRGWPQDRLATAKQLGIPAGIGDNLCAPGREVPRQEIFHSCIMR